MCTSIEAVFPIHLPKVSESYGKEAPEIALLRNSRVNLLTNGFIVCMNRSKREHTKRKTREEKKQDFVKLPIMLFRNSCLKRNVHLPNAIVLIKL
jgi:hypothetical protein